MGRALSPELIPRKRPLQARSTVTVAAIFEGALQVLVKDGLTQFTTTRVVNRAGVSVGTLYQYFPNKRALLYALLERHVTTIADTLEATCRDHHGTSVATMADAVVDGYLRAKLVESDASHILCMIAAELDSAGLIASQTRRAETATAKMLSTACDADFVDPALVSQTLLAAVIGTARALFDDKGSTGSHDEQKAHITLMARAYLRAVGNADRASAASLPATLGSWGGAVSYIEGQPALPLHS